MPRGVFALLTLMKQTRCQMSLDPEQVEAMYAAVMKVLELSYNTKHDVVLDKDEFLVLYELVKCLERSEWITNKISHGDEKMNGTGKEKVTLHLSANDVNEIIRNVLISKGYEVLEDAEFKVCETAGLYTAGDRSYGKSASAGYTRTFAGATYVVSRHRI